MNGTAAMAGVCIGLALSGCGPSNPFRSGPDPFTSPGEARVPYGTQDKEDVTGAVTTVSMDENEHFQSVLQMLRSHVPGLQVTELPDGGIHLRIRGDQQSLQVDDASNQPLLIIDDMPILASGVRGALLSLIPSQVESITVLKDLSSTAIYGSRGANGVILIRQKR